MSDPASDKTDPAPRKGAGPLVYAIPLALVAGFGALAWMTLATPQSERQALPSALIAKPVPQMDLPSLHPGGENLSTAVLQRPGVKIVNIWASWCGPCRIEHPELMKLAETTGVPVYGINYKDDPDKARAFLKQLGDPFAIVGEDETGRMGIEWGVYGVPETFVIDGEGRIAYKHVGPIQVDDLEKRVLPAMRKAGWQG